MASLSVVISVYNKGPFLKRCLDSCAKQTGDVEFIVVDDGSTDGGGEICDLYDGGKFRVFHKENGGVSSARNLGIEKATKEYITFLDADDELGIGAVRTMLGYLGGAEIYEFNHKRQYRDLPPVMKKPVRPGVYNFANRQAYWWGVWNKCFLRKFINDNQIRFDESCHYGEDEVFVLECLGIKDSYRHIWRDGLIRHFDDQNSLVHSLTYKGILEQWYSEQRLAKKFEQINPEFSDKVWELISEHEKSIIYTRKMNGMGPREFIEGKNYPKPLEPASFLERCDIVYLLRDGENPELKYSLRSLVNIPHRKVVFVGGKPEGLEPDLYIPVDQSGDKWDNAQKNLLVACQDDRLSEDIILFNDDFFVMKPVDRLPTFVNKTLVDLSRLVTHNGRVESEYIAKRIKPAIRKLRNKGLPLINYELHLPMIINREKMIQIYKIFQKPEAKRSFYGNYYRIKGKEIDPLKMNDGSVQSLTGKLLEDRIFISTTDESWQGEVGKQIRQRFKKKSPWEVAGK